MISTIFNQFKLIAIKTCKLMLSGEGKGERGIPCSPKMFSCLS
ncbi:hypothetical protein PLUTE_b0380 [Pseudoalteromonas luteoviolacea DSM 6061]|nr:hypothetical protein [Pseudoalteromonas luteoviolacea DSM 6061]